MTPIDSLSSYSCVSEEQVIKPDRDQSGKAELG